MTTIPTVPESIVDKVAFFVHADPNFFTLDDLRRYGGNIKIIKDRRAPREHEVLQLGPRSDHRGRPAHVRGGRGARSRIVPEPQVKSASQKNTDAKTYYAVLQHNMPVRVTISDGNGNVLDGFEINSTNSIRYGNEKIATMESGPLGGFSYTSGQFVV